MSAGENGVPDGPTDDRLSSRVGYGLGLWMGKISRGVFWVALALVVFCGAANIGWFLGFVFGPRTADGAAKLGGLIGIWLGWIALGNPAACARITMRLHRNGPGALALVVITGIAANATRQVVARTRTVDVVWTMALVVEAKPLKDAPPLLALKAAGQLGGFLLGGLYLGSDSFRDWVNAYGLGLVELLILCLAVLGLFLVLGAWGAGIPVAQFAKRFAGMAAVRCAKYGLFCLLAAVAAFWAGDTDLATELPIVAARFGEAVSKLASLDPAAVRTAIRVLTTGPGGSVSAAVMGGRLALAGALLCVVAITAALLLGVGGAVFQKIRVVLRQRQGSATVEEQRAYGAAPFVDPNDAADQLRGERR